MLVQITQWRETSQKKNHDRAIQRVEFCHYPLTRIKQLISLSQNRKYSLFFWSFREEALMSFSGDTVKPWIFGQKDGCSILTATHLHHPHSICLGLPHTKGFQQKDPTLSVWEPPQLKSYSFHTQSPQLIGLEQKDRIFLQISEDIYTCTKISMTVHYRQESIWWSKASLYSHFLSWIITNHMLHLRNVV